MSGLHKSPFQACKPQALLDAQANVVRNRWPHNDSDADGHPTTMMTVVKGRGGSGSRGSGGGGSVVMTITAVFSTVNNTL